MNGRRIIYITRKELETLDINIPIYILVDPEPTTLNSFNNGDIYNISVDNVESSIENTINIINTFPNNCQSSTDLLSQHDFLCDDGINFNDDFITSIEITTEPADNDDQIKTPEYQDLYNDDFYDSICNSDANSDHKSSDKDSSLRFNNSFSSLTAVVSKTLDSYKHTLSNSFNRTPERLQCGIVFSNVHDSSVLNNMLYGDINDSELQNHSENTINEFQVINSVEITDAIQSPSLTTLSCVVTNSLASSSISSFSVSEYDVSTSISNSVTDTVDSKDFTFVNFDIISSNKSQSRISDVTLKVNIPSDLSQFSAPPPGMCPTSASQLDSFKIPCSVSYTSIPPFCSLSYPMPRIDVSKPPPTLLNIPFNMPPPALVNESSSVHTKDQEIAKIKSRRNAARTEKMPLIFRQYSSLEMNLNERYLKRQKNNKNVVIGAHKMKSIETKFANSILSRRENVMINQPVWCAIDRSEFGNKDAIDEESDRLSAKEDKANESDSDSVDSLLLKSDSDDDVIDPMRESNFTRLQMNQLALIEKKVKATRKRLNLNKPMQMVDLKNNCGNSSRKRTKTRLGYQSNPPKKAKQSAGYLTIQEKNLQNNAPVISGGRTTEQQAEINHKLKHPYKLNPDIWYNEANELNDGPACSCATKYQIGPLHNEYHGETAIPLCEPHSNNYGKLFHYRLIISPPINFLSTSPTTIKHKDKDYSFAGYSIFTHKRIVDLPFCQIVRFNIVYHLSLIEDAFPPGFTVRTLDLMTDYMFTELLELLDVKWWPKDCDQQNSCRAIHLLPRFERALAHKGVELLSADVILKWMMDNAKQPLFDVMDLPRIHAMSQSEWSELIDPLRGTLATFPGKKPAAIRVDQVDRISLQTKATDDVLIFPVIVHMSMAPMKLGLTREPAYKRLLRNFLKLQYLILNRPEVSTEDRAELNNLARLLENFEMNGIQRREFTVEISSDGFYKTGISTDMVQFALCIPSMMAHIRFHLSLSDLEERIKYRFRDKSLIHQALTHPSFRNTNYGTNPDHYQNTMTSCGLRHIEYGDKIGLYRSFRKKGLSKMVHVMSHMPYRHETRSNIYGNERLECHGDAVIELITSVHLFYMFPELSEGHLDAFRQALVQNHYLADLSVKLGFHKYLLYTHNMDFSYDSTITHARSDAFEAVMAAIALDGGLDEADRIFGSSLFGDDARIHKVWCELPLHPLQEQFPRGDRHVIQNSPIFQHLTELEDRLGIYFKHIRLLAKAMTIRKTGYNFFTLGDNQRLEFLGDSLLKYVTTDYLYKHFPRHHEGHLSLLRNTLVNRYTQATVCTELGLDEFIIRKDSSNKANQLDKANQKPRADLLEAFLGALFVDKDLTWVERFSQVCFWPRLVDFILNQSWNDPKSRLQQCCLTYRSLNEDPEIAHYKLITTFGSTDHREFKVAVYFRGVRLATGFGKSIQAAQMNAATLALDKYKNEFRQLDYQEKVINNHYDKNTRKKILNQFENWDSELIDKFVEKPQSSFKSMANKFVPESKLDYSTYGDHDNQDCSDKIRSIALTSSLGELLKSVKKK